MTILASELKCYKSATVNDTAANGGRRGSQEVVDGAAQNVFPHVFKAERTAGLLRYRKIFYCNINSSGEVAYGSQPFFHHPPDASADHYLWWFPGDYANTQGDLTGSERKYGSAYLSANATAGSTTLVVTCKHADQTAMFADGDPIMVSGKATPEAATGTEELHTISGAPVVSGLQVTITTASALANGYTAGSSSVSSGTAGVDLGATVSGWAESFAGDGAYDEATYPLELDNIGTVYDTYTLTFDGSGNVTVVGAVEGNLGTFSIAADVAPVNAGRDNNAYFTWRMAGLSGTPQAGDTIIFTTEPAEQSVWEVLSVPAGADPIGNGGFYSYHDVETA